MGWRRVSRFYHRRQNRRIEEPFRDTSDLMICGKPACLIKPDVALPEDCDLREMDDDIASTRSGGNCGEHRRIVCTVQQSLGKCDPLAFFFREALGAPI